MPIVPAAHIEEPCPSCSTGATRPLSCIGPEFLCVDLANQKRNGFVQIPVVDLCEQPTQDRCTESFQLNNLDELGPARIQWRKDVVVVDRQPKERANPLPVAI